MVSVVVGAVIGAVAYGVAGTTIMTAIAIGLAAAALYSVATMEMPGGGSDPQSQKQMVRTANSPYRGIYGTVIESGPVVYAEEHETSKTITEQYVVCNSSPGQGRVCTKHTRTIQAGETWMHVVVVLAGHPVDSISEVYFDDELKTNWDDAHWKINAMTGSQNSINDIPQALRDIPTWTDTMVGAGLTWLHVMLKPNASIFPNGIPNIKAKIHGRPVVTPFFNGFTNNASAVIYDYLKYHFKTEDRQINQESFKNEFNLCKEVMVGEYNPDWGVDVIRYAIDGGFDYDETHEQVLKKMLSACGGELIYTNGQYYLQVAAYRGPVGSAQTISLSDINDAISISPDTGLSDRINTVKGTYVDPIQNYQVVDFEPVTNKDYVTEDGEELVKDAPYEYVLNIHQAHRLANIILKDNRMGLMIEAPMNMRGFKFDAGLPVKFDDKSLGYDKLEFRVVKWKVKPGKGVTLTLKQTAVEIYDDSIATVRPKPPVITFPDPSYVHPISSLTFIPLDDDNVYDGIVSWSHPKLSAVRHFEVIYISSGGDATKVTTTDTLLRLKDMQGVEYTIIVTAFNEFGAKSQPVTLTADIGVPKAIQKVIFKPENFSMVINPVVSGSLPINTSFIYYRGHRGVEPPVFSKSEYIGTGKTFVDVGLNSKTYYHYFIQVANDAAITDAYGPYTAETTDDPKDIMDVIGPSIPGTYTWIVYAIDAFGAGISLTYDPKIHKFEGRAINKSVKQPSLNPQDYFFVRIGGMLVDKDNVIEAHHIIANAVTTEKIAVTVVEPVNNFSQYNNLRGWDTDGTLVTEIPLNGQTTRTLKVVNRSSDNNHIRATKFKVDHSAIYEVRTSIYQASGSADVGYLAVCANSAGVKVETDTYHPITKIRQWSTVWPTFWQGRVVGWRHMVSYLVGATADINNCPDAINVSSIIKFSADVDTVGIDLVAYAGNVVESHFYSPGVIKVGSGVISANVVKANALITAPRIEGGSVVGTTFNNGNGTFSVSAGGKVIAKDVDVKGKITATSGSFTGAINATSGTFKGRVEASSGFFSGEIRGGSGYFSGTVYANKVQGSFTGAITTTTASTTGFSEPITMCHFRTNSNVLPMTIVFMPIELSPGRGSVGTVLCDVELWVNNTVRATDRVKCTVVKTGSSATPSYSQIAATSTALAAAVGTGACTGYIRLAPVNNSGIAIKSQAGIYIASNTGGYFA